MQFFGFLKLLMAFLGSSWPLLGRYDPKMGPKMDPKRGPKSEPKNDPKNDQKMIPKMTKNDHLTLKKIALTESAPDQVV